MTVTADALCTTITDITTSETSRLAALGRGFDGFEIRPLTREGIRLGYRVAGQGEMVVLVHGFPQSGYAFHDLAAALARDYRVVVPDYRGAASSDAPAAGYDKATMARDLHQVVRDAGHDRVHLVGHDIGTTVAFAYASLFGPELATLTLLDGIVPGTATMNMIVATGRPWHFGFHRQVALATSLPQGRERIYLDWLFDNNMADPSRVTPQERDQSVRALQAPGALAAASKTYASWFTDDGPANQAFLAAHGKLHVPVLVAGGEASLGPVMAMVGNDIATDVTAAIIPAAGHFLMEEQPAEVERLLRAHLTSHAGVPASI